MIDPQINHSQGDTQTRCQQRVGRLPVTQLPGLNRVVSLRGSGAPSVPTVEHSPGGLVREPPEPSPPPLVLSDWSPIGSGLGYPVPTMDLSVTLLLPSDPTARENTGKDQGGLGKRGHHLHAQLAEEILVPRSPDGM